MLSAGLILASNELNFCNIIIAVVALALLFDILAANISMAFVTKDPISNLRSFLLTFFAFTHIIIFYAIFYRFFERDFPDGMFALQALYFSVITITTVGYGDIVPKSQGTTAQIIIMFELLTGLFFVTGVFARIIGFKEKEN